MADAERPLDRLIATLDDYLVKRAPFQIPEGGKELIVRFGPWISLILLVLTLPLVLAALGIGAIFAPFAGVQYATGFGLAAILACVQIVLLVIALPGLFARKMSGWTLILYSELLSLLSSVLSGAIVSGLIGALIGLYILFQVRTKYS